MQALAVIVALSGLPVPKHGQMSVWPSRVGRLLRRAQQERVASRPQGRAVPFGLAIVRRLLRADPVTTSLYAEALIPV